MTSFSNIALAFAEGLLLVLSPCILPVLPLVLGASLQGGKQRPFGIVCGFVLAFTIFAYISRAAVIAANISPEAIRNASLYMLITLGAIMLFPNLSNLWGKRFGNLGERGNTLINRVDGNSFLSGMGIGALIGLVWTPCAGPILAAAVIGIIQAKTDLAAMGTIAAFALGAGIPMLAIALSGQKIMGKLGFLKKHADSIRRGFGVLMIAAACIILAGWDVKLASLGAGSAMTPTMGILEGKLENPTPAPELAGLTNWINSEPLTLQQLRGKVVLIDFWTYSCINCIRTLPHVTAWYDKYKDDGFVVLGIHTPEFAFERDAGNVKDAVAEYKIHYPVALDNAAATWQAYSNKYWPAHYLIDREGRIVYTHFGEGNYDITENNIRLLLGQMPEKAKADANNFDTSISPETYLGYFRAENFASPEGQIRDKETAYTAPANLQQNQWALEGRWNIREKKIVGTAGAAIRFNYKAKQVHLVMGSADGKPIDVDVSVNGTPTSTITVGRNKLYTLVDSTDGAGVITIKAKRGRLEAYAFTFGAE